MGVLEACDELGVLTYPAMVAHGVWVVPLFSWYDRDFNPEDRDRGGREVDFEPMCIWPFDRDEAYSYMLRMNAPRLEFPYQGTVISFSHCLPHLECPFAGRSHRMGAAGLDEQLR